jgi:hypothetical protein
MTSFWSREIISVLVALNKGALVTVGVISDCSDVQRYDVDTGITVASFRAKGLTIGHDRHLLFADEHFPISLDGCNFCS